MMPNVSVRRRPLPAAQTSAPESILGRKHRPDYLITVCMVTLLAIGLIVIYSVSPAISAQLSGNVDANHFMYRQLLYLLIGLSVFTATALLPLKLWQRINKQIIGAAIISFILLLIPSLSLSYGGATRWVHIGPISYQPAEILKFGLLFYLAAFLVRRIHAKQIDNRQTLYLFLTLLGLAALEIVVVQRDMGTMIPILAMMLTMLYLTGIRFRKFAMVLSLVITAGVLLIAAAPHRMARVFTFLNPESDPMGQGYHINQALIAVGSGGFFGKGLGRSVQAFGYLPEAANDSIFAIMAEKFGFLGTLVVFGLYAALFFRIIKVIERAPNLYLRLVAGGIFAWLCVQAFVNMGAMLGIMPLTGVTLPFLSFGGTSLVFTLAALGVILNISRYTKLGNDTAEREPHADTTRWRGVGRSRYST